MRQIIFIIFIVLLVFSGCAKKTTDETQTETVEDVATSSQGINIGFFNVHPHIWLDEGSGEIKGAVFELVEKYFAPEMGIKFNWENEATTIPRQIERLKTEKNYAAALLIFTPPRLEFSLFPESPYFLSQSAITIMKTNPLEKITKVEDINKMTIGYAQKAFITPFAQDESIHFELVGDPDYHRVNYEKILKNRIDAAYAPDKAGLLALIKEMNLQNDFKVLDLPEAPAQFHVVFSKDLEDSVNKYNKAFKKLDGQALYLKLLGKYLDISQL